MGDVLVTLKVMPEGVDSDLKVIEDRLREVDAGRFNSLEKVPIAFGLVALKATYVVADEGGAAERLEEAIKGIEGVKTVETIEASLV
ncbi:MAG: elongation factor 1-beta [Methanobacteriota archaeon]|nr:MAG: elongation factor 1-beta [Euryarchaeota archaeon]